MISSCHYVGCRPIPRSTLSVSRRRHQLRWIVTELACTPLVPCAIMSRYSSSLSFVHPAFPPIHFHTVAACVCRCYRFAALELSQKHRLEGSTGCRHDIVKKYWQLNPNRTHIAQQWRMHGFRWVWTKPCASLYCIKPPYLMPSWQNTVLLYFRVRRRFTIYNLYFSGTFTAYPRPTDLPPGCWPWYPPWGLPCQGSSVPHSFFPESWIRLE